MDDQYCHRGRNPYKGYKYGSRCSHSGCTDTAALDNTPVKPAPELSGSVDRGASASVNPEETTSANAHYELAYDPVSFLPLPQPVNVGGLWAPREISSRVTILPYSFSTYISKNMAPTDADPLPPHEVLQDLMMSMLNPTGIAYISDMANRQVRQQEREIVMTQLSLSHTHLGLNQYCYLLASECPSSKCLTDPETQPNTWRTIFQGAAQL